MMMRCLENIIRNFMPVKRSLLIALAINLFFLALCVFFGDLRFGAIDDYFMAAVLTGAHGDSYNPLIVFVNALYAYALLPLYHLFPTVGWYYLGLMASVFFSFLTITFIILEVLGLRLGSVFSALFVALFASDFYLVCQFTQTASILSASGMLCLIWAAFYKRHLGFMVWGAFLLFLGSLIRYQAFMMGLPFLGITMLFFIKDLWPSKWRLGITLAVTLIAIFAAHSFDQQLYQNNESYKDFMAFQAPRVVLGDGSDYNQQAVYEDLEEMGFSGRDFALLKDWTFYDTETFSVKNLSPIVQTIPRYKYSVKWQRMPQFILSALMKSARSPLFWAWVILSLALFQSRKKMVFYPWATLGLIFCLMTYLLMMNRLVYRVESGFWLYAACLTIPFLKSFSLLETHKIFKKSYWVFAFLTLIAVVNLVQYVRAGEIVRDPSTGAKRTLTLENDSTDYEQVFKYIEERPDFVFLTSMNAYMRFSHHKMPPWRAEPFGSYKNIIPLGYWTPYLPEVTRELEKRGVKNPMKEAIHPNVIVINEGRLNDFLERHYYDKVKVDTVKAIGEMIFYKYSLEEGL